MLNKTFANKNIDYPNITFNIILYSVTVASQIKS